jgi:CDP-diacylglycerol pyrophosphatase
MLVILAGVVLLALIGGVAASDRLVLWRVVQACVLDHGVTGLPFPCLEVNVEAGRDRGYVVLRAPLQTTHVVVSPTVRVEGIESPGLVAPDAPNYVADAWRARRYVETTAGKPVSWGDIGLAVNSRPGRSQDQLHIHVDCVHPSVRDYLHAHDGDMRADGWTHLAAPMHGTRYWALRLPDDDLGPVNVFKLAAAGLKVAPEAMPNLTVVLVGAAGPSGPSGFYLLADLDRPHRGQLAHGEFLLDHSCMPS